MTNRTTDSFQGEGGHPHRRGPPDHLHSRTGNKVFKNGLLFLSSKGIGWTSRKKRWLILTRTSLVFFRSDPVTVN
ncbi:rho GTPase-activating protein REN1-like isoform X2 [Actinidia eriantha]|uniref:rho GTPase-activating protein REN1-like isoform X2 n=1 Tax=Actinidia eriantha TaxID=165200 RepID=UPI00258F2094|nr:rho GTPase-activating protein REN1-like isoform X2 [Actinidia eriantha]